MYVLPTIAIRGLRILLLADRGDPLALAGTYQRDMDGLRVELRLVMLHDESRDSIRKPPPVRRRHWIYIGIGGCGLVDSDEGLIVVVDS